MARSESSALEKRPAKKELLSKKKAMAGEADDIRVEYDFSKMKGVRGKYFHRAWAGSGVRCLNADLAKLFPDDQSVNRALRMLVDLAKSQPRLRKAS